MNVPYRGYEKDAANDGRQDAASAGLRYVSDDRPGVRRRRSGKGFSYVQPDGLRLCDRGAVKRIRALAIPPAWQEVWICPFADGHLQATGRDAKGRKQYRYHLSFREVRETTKYEHLIAFADVLPVLRARVRQHMALRGLPREKILATVVYLLDTTLIRIGNDDYARQNKSYGLTTLQNRHVDVEGTEVRFRFVGKSGKPWFARIRNRRIAKIIRACQDLPGQELLQYLDDDGVPRDVASSDVNAYLREVTGADITAKDFRTWAGTVLCAVALHEMEDFTAITQAKRNIRSAVTHVAARLGNTAAICRKCYVHPAVPEAYLAGRLALDIEGHRNHSVGQARDTLAPEEAALMDVLRAYLRGTKKQNATASRVRRPSSAEEPSGAAAV
jgi:DNA topoisomerase I